MRAPVLREREVPTVNHFSSEPAGASVYAFDATYEKRHVFLGKTPCDATLMTFELSEYVDQTAEYAVNMTLPHRITRPIDYSDPENSYGEITFDFVFELTGYENRIEKVCVAATNEVLVKALALNRVPEYKLDVKIEE